MAQLTIKGQIFDIADDPTISPGVPLTEGMAATLQQTRRENIRNNMAKKVEEALNGSGDLPADKFEELQRLVAEYADKYEFGVRQPGAPRAPRPSGRGRWARRRARLRWHRAPRAPRAARRATRC